MVFYDLAWRYCEARGWIKALTSDLSLAVGIVRRILVV